MTWRTVHPGDPEARDLPVDPPLHGYDPADERYDTARPWTCNGPGPLREECVDDAGRRYTRTVEPCPDCAGGSHRGPLRVITLDGKAAAS